MTFTSKVGVNNTWNATYMSTKNVIYSVPQDGVETKTLPRPKRTPHNERQTKHSFRRRCSCL